MKTLSLCMIVKDEQENLPQCLNSVRKYVDEIVIVDTGSTDKTREIAVSYGANVYQFDHTSHPDAFFKDDEATCSQFLAPGPYSGEWALGDFGAARNESFSHATGDYTVWIDADDVLENGEELRNIVADMDQRGIGIGFLAYNYATDHLGRVFYRQWRERVLKRDTAKWINPVHEVLIPNGQVGPVSRYEKPVYIHKRKPDRKSIPNRNYKILLRQAWQLKSANPDQPLDPRILFYLGQEARFIEPQKAVGFYEEYLQHSGWPEERAAAHVALGTLLELGVLGLPPAKAYAQADREYAAAAAEVPENPDGLFGLARIAYLRGRFNDCIGYTERGMKIGNTDSMLGANPMDRVYRPHVYYNHALAKVGRVDEAIASCEAGLRVMPDDPGVPGGAPGMLKHNLAVYLKAKEEEKKKTEPALPDAQGKPMALFDKNEDVNSPPAHNIPRDAQVIWAMQLWKQVMASGDYAKAQRLLESLPSTITADPVIDRMFAATKHKANPRTAHETKDMVFYLGAGPEPWDPSTPNTKGLGGSETACIEMAKNLAKLGHTVTVYAEATGIFDGVNYRHHTEFKGTACDVFIASRAPWAIQQFGTVVANVKLLWVHDIHCGPASPNMERWLYQFDRVLCLSRWHKEYFASCYPTLHPDRIIVTRNGIDPARFAAELPKQNILPFTSSPNRGLITLLGLMPAIRERVPDAVVHGAYGLDTWLTFAKQRGDAAELAEIDRYQRTIDEAQRAGFLVWHGKVTQKKIAELFLSAKIWAYPTDFPETSCISAMEAMAAGAVPVCTRRAALGETVKHGVVIDDVPNAGQWFVDECVRLMTRESVRAPIAQTARRYAFENLSWEGLAKDWSQMFGQLAGAVAENPVALWKAAA